jgi:hypothetical protein
MSLEVSSGTRPTFDFRLLNVLFGSGYAGLGIRKQRTDFANFCKAVTLLKTKQNNPHIIKDLHWACHAPHRPAAL